MVTAFGCCNKHFGFPIAAGHLVASCQESKRAKDSSWPKRRELGQEHKRLALFGIA